MLGAVLGDILGSNYEGSSSDSRTDSLYSYGSVVTDDSVCTIAVAEATLTGTAYADALREWGTKFPRAGYGAAFLDWLQLPNAAPYGSFGNGALMRVSPAIALADSLEQAHKQAALATAVTHNHPVSFTAVEAYTSALWTALQGGGKAAVCQALQRGGAVAHSVNAAHSAGTFHIRADDTLADVLSCLRDATSFESLMRECLYHGGDTDTICAVAGPLGEALWGIPLRLIEPGWSHIPEPMQLVLVEEYKALARFHPYRYGD